MEPITVSYSELDTFRQCPLKHELSYRQRWTRPVKPGGALERGNLWHEVMEAHYRVLQTRPAKQGQPRTPRSTATLLRAARRAVEPLLRDPSSGQQTELQELTEWMYDGHVERYGAQDHWQILGVEQKVVTPLVDPKGRPSRFLIKAKLDLIVRDWSLGGHTYVVDHKSGANLPTKDDLELNDQFALYCWILCQTGQPARRSLHSAVRTTRNKGDYPLADGATSGRYKPQTLDQRFSMTPLPYSSQELRNVALDAYNTAAAAYPEVGDPPRYSSPDPKNCGWRCDFKDVHLTFRKTSRTGPAVLREHGFEVYEGRH